jgi:4-hydroxy-3-methylbut-2-en-1-yl diphosphate synthase IspG/GcpE
VPLVADIHFQPAVAMMVAEAFEKVRSRVAYCSLQQQHQQHRLQQRWQRTVATAALL